MPNLDVTEQENADLTAFLEWVGNIDNHDWPPRTRKRRCPLPSGVSPAPDCPGRFAFKENCIRRHSLGGSGGSSGPALDSVGDKYDTGTISRLIADPASVQPDQDDGFPRYQ